MRPHFAQGILMMALAWPALASAADLPPQLPAPAPAAPPGNAGGFAAPDGTCLEWTDGCRTCQRPPAGEAACSNVGIACVPQAMRCTRR
jgi:hypothetical protein